MSFATLQLPLLLIVKSLSAEKGLSAYRFNLSLRFSTLKISSKASRNASKVFKKTADLGVVVYIQTLRERANGSLELESRELE